MSDESLKPPDGLKTAVRGPCLGTKRSQAQDRSPRQSGVSDVVAFSAAMRNARKRTACHSTRPALGEGRIDAIPEAVLLVATSPDLSQAADDTHGDLDRA
jgi:hypothetical protein